MTDSRLRAALAGLLALICVAAAGCSTDNGPDPVALPTTVSAPSTDPAADASLARFYGQKLSWKSCGDLTCAKLTVPLDWAAPAGSTMAIGLAKHEATREKVGTLFINPGGPGASGVDYAKVAEQAFGRGILRHFDIVGFDPRGVGQSSQIECLPQNQLDKFFAADTTPDNIDELGTAQADAKRWGAACVQNSSAVVRHADTLSVVHDLDVMRAAVGDKRLSYFGASYGTFIGAWYAETFPWRVGRLVLDGAVDPSVTSAQYTEGQAEGFGREFRAYLTDCVGHKGCPLRGTVDEGLKTLANLVADADLEPLRTADKSRPLTQSLLQYGLGQGAYNPSLWPSLSDAIKDALEGDGNAMLELADAYLERSDNGKYGATLQANAAIFCLDHPETRSPDDIAKTAEALRVKYPPLGDSIGWGSLGCREWPVPAVLSPRRLTAAGADPILVVGSTGDPATPYKWAQSLASQLSSGRLLTREGNGHTGYRRGNGCVDRAVEAYLLTGAAPARGAGTRCPSEG